MNNKEINSLLADLKRNTQMAASTFQETGQLNSKDIEVDTAWTEFWLGTTERILRNTNNRLQQLASHRMLIYDDTVEPKLFWQGIMSTVQFSILTTNFVGMSTFGSALNNELLLVQKKAIERGVNIQRLFVYREGDPQQLVQLISHMSTQLAYGIKVYAIQSNVFMNAKTTDGFETGSDDFMIIDDCLVYETHYSPGTSTYNNVLQKNIEDLERKKKIWETVIKSAKKINFDNVNTFNVEF